MTVEDWNRRCKEVENEIFNASRGTPINRKELIVLCGLPGSGKSTYAKKKWGNSHIIICADEFRKVYTGKDFDLSAEHMVYLMVSTTVEVLLRRSMPVVIDMTSLTIKNRLKWIDLAKRCSAPIRCVLMDIAVCLCLARNADRKRKVPENVINDMASRFVYPTDEEGFVSVETVNEWTYGGSKCPIYQCPECLRMNDNCTCGSDLCDMD